MSARRGSPRATRLVLLLLVVAAGGVFACNALLGLSDFDVTPDPTEAGGGDTSMPIVDSGGGCADGQTSDVDLKLECYPCNPLTPQELLNACTAAQCIPFDRARLTNLLPNGELPPLPVDLDGG